MRRPGKIEKQSRREFIKVVGLAGGGLLLATYFPVKTIIAKSGGRNGVFSPSVFLRIDHDGIVTVIVQRSEMGQGVRTALPMLVAEELEVDWKYIRVEQADANPKYGDQTTGGSRSIRISYRPFRVAGATARVMLITAAAARWKVNTSDCYAEDGFVINRRNNKKLAYGELVDDAAKLPVPKNVKLKDPKDFKIIGKRIHRTDTPDKVYGKAKFGMDVVVPGMFYSAVRHCPTFGGSVKSFDDSAAKRIDGVVDVRKISTGIAVTATSTWSAFKGKEAVKVQWDPGPNANLDTETIRRQQQAHLNESGSDIEVVGKPAPKGPGDVNLESVYEVPFLCHAPMEPMDCTAEVRNGKAVLRAPTQNPQGLRTDVAKFLGFDEDDVVVHVTLMGGAFGRRIMSDWGVEAAEISRVTGRTAKLTWTREDDMKHSFYRPMSTNKLTGSVSAGGKPMSLTHHVIAESIVAQRFNRAVPVAKSGLGEGTTELEYKIPYIRITGTIVPTVVPVSWYRSVYHSQNPFALECFLDEMAAAARKDPYEFRRELLPEDSRLRAVLVEAAEKSGWNRKLEKGRGRGIACGAGYGSFVACVAEVTVSDNKPKVDRMVFAIDCGIVINPDIVEAQLEGTAAFGLSAVLKSEIHIENGGVVESNFDDYQILNLEEMPKVEVHIMKNEYKVGGVGEAGMGVVAPAVCNAIFSACGKRVRRLPVNLG